jgi:hypothetical protein
MSAFWINISAGLCLALCSTTLAWADSSSQPKDTTPYARPATPEDTAGALPGTAAPDASPNVSIIRVVDTVVNNTDPNLKNTDTFNDG